MELTAQTMEELAFKKFNKAYCELDWEKQVEIRREIISQLAPKAKVEEKFDVNENIEEL